MEFYTYTLPNGIRGIHRRTRSSVAHCALIINAGSRDELSSEFGLAHFTEHALFKGTTSRKAWQVNCRLENLGGELNAFTTKEDTTIHATTLRADFTKAVELIADIAHNSTYPQKELEREKEVIRDEINSYRDLPVEWIYDSFEDLLFSDSELGHSILGNKKLLKKFDTQSIFNFTGRTHTTDQMVFSSIGNISPQRIEAIAMRYFGGIEQSHREFTRQRPGSITSFDISESHRTHQSHCIIGTRAYDIVDPKRLPLALLINILGGPSANSRLNVSIREKQGLTYNIEASYTPYTDCGIASIYFSSDHSNTDRCIELINKEIDRVKNESITPLKLSMAKRQFTAQLAISMESNEGYMLGAGKSFLLYNEIDTMEQVYAKIQSITASDLMEVANETFSAPSQLTYR